MELVMPIVAEALINIVFLLVTAVLVMGVQYLRKLLTVEQQKLIENVIDLAILYVQQTMPFGSPEAKLRNAVDAFVLLAKRYGIKLDTEYIIYLIEARLKALKEEFGDAWAGEGD